MCYGTVRYGTVWFKRALRGLCCRCCCVGRWRLRGRWGGGAWEKGEGGGGREKGGWKDGRGGCGKDEDADPTYLHYLQHPQPRYFPPKWRNNSGEGNEIVAGWYRPPPPTHSLSCLPQPTHSETSSQHHRSNLILIFSSQLGHHIHHLFTSTSDMNLFYRVR